MKTRQKRTSALQAVFGLALFGLVVTALGVGFVAYRVDSFMGVLASHMVALGAGVAYFVK